MLTHFQRAYLNLKLKLKGTSYETDKERTFEKFLATDCIHFPRPLPIVFREDSLHSTQSLKCLVKNTALAVLPENGCIQKPPCIKIKT